MSFKFGPKSIATQKGVHPDLIRVANTAITLCTVDFSFFEGLRTKERQAMLVRTGKSQTTNSMHLVQKDGYGHAMDLVPTLTGWNDWDPFYAIAEAVDKACDVHQVELIWGGLWGKPLGTYGSTAAQIKAAQAAYVAARRKAGRSAFIDGPHFELAR